MSPATARSVKNRTVHRSGRFWAHLSSWWQHLPLWAAVLLTVLPLLALLWGLLLQDLFKRQNALQREHEDRIYSVTQVSAQALKGLLLVVDQTLLELREEWVNHPETFTERVENRRRVAHSTLGVDMHIAVIGADGRVQYSSIAPEAVGFDASADRHFAMPRNNPANRMFVGPPYFMPVARQQLMPFSRRLPPAADGSFSGVIVFWVPPDFVTRIYKTTRFQANSTFTLIELERGQILLRHVKSSSSDPLDASGKTLEDTDDSELKPAFPLKDEYLSSFLLTKAQELSATGVGRWFSLIDRSERTFGWYKFKTVPFALVAGEPTTHIDQELAGVAQRYWLTGGLLSVLLTASVAGSMTLLRTRARATARQAEQLQDMAEKQAELEQSHEHLRRLGQHLATVRDTERQRIAQDLHDELGQRLSVMRLGAAHIAQQLAQSQPTIHPDPASAQPPRAASDPSTLQPAALSLKAQIDDTIAVVRQIAEDLRPGALSVGLGPGIESLCDEFQNVLGLRCLCDIQLPADTVVPTETATAAYRIVQEGLTNVIRHAQATEFEVVVDAHDGWLLLSVNDNGLGFRPGDHTHRTLGLLGMQERARAIGGEVHIHSVPGLGTRVKARLPLAPATSNDTHNASPSARPASASDTANPEPT